MLLALLLLAPVANDVPQRLVGGALADGMAYQRLSELTDTVGARLSGSPGAEAAVQWALQRFKQDGLDAHLEPVKVPHWVRGEETGEILAGARRQPLAITALGGSVGGDVTAEVVEARSLDDLRDVRGKVVFFNHEMNKPQDYGRDVDLRSRGPAVAGRAGAVGVLLRSLATASFRSPHTGVTIYEADAPRIPAAAVSTEDADFIHRMLARGPVKAHFTLGCRWLPDADSFNVVADVRGRERPDEIVLMGAHLDSWDLAQGANDDGAGVAMVMEAGRLLQALPQHPRRTVRVVLFMNEENGLAGGKAYAAAHAGELAKHVAAIEADAGAGRALGITLRAGDGGDAMLMPWLEPLHTALGIGLQREGEAGGADISPMGPAQVPFAGVHVDPTHYFDIHHSAADTLDKIDPQLLAQDAAAHALLAYGLAEMPQPLPRPPAREPRNRQEPLKAH
ncbi:MAG TPA: M20/M25/M40 family metallo-hydrolase [Myxococcales bacterium]|nr:M20/M25/M40 family metallo-hydrolase [Myxococcales bacterium]